MRIGIDLGGTKIEGLALDTGGAERVRERVATPRDDYAATLRAIADLVERLEAEVGANATVGVAMPGALSPATGLVKNANSTWLNGRPLDRDLEALLQRDVRFANDANCFAVSEATDGAATGAAVAFGVILGTGVGGGVALRGRPLLGANAVGGEWGHNPLPWPTPDDLPAPACYCGKHGCLETYLSGPGMAADHRRATGASATAVEIVAAAAAGDPGADATLRRYEDRLARGLATVINVLDPDVIVLGGGLSQITRLYDAVLRLWGEHAFTDRVTTALRPPRWGDSSGVRGAAWLWPPD
ncbi:MAG: ROK family protein [Planctomycetota bacterium]